MTTTRSTRSTHCSNKLSRKLQGTTASALHEMFDVLFNTTGQKKVLGKSSKSGSRQLPATCHSLLSMRCVCYWQPTVARNMSFPSLDEMCIESCPQIERQTAAEHKENTCTQCQSGEHKGRARQSGEGRQETTSESEETPTTSMTPLAASTF